MDAKDLLSPEERKHLDSYIGQNVKLIDIKDGFKRMFNRGIETPTLVGYYGKKNPWANKDYSGNGGHQNGMSESYFRNLWLTCLNKSGEADISKMVKEAQKDLGYEYKNPSMFAARCRKLKLPYDKDSYGSKTKRKTLLDI